MRTRLTGLITFVLLALNAFCQNVPLGTWTDHLPLKSGLAVAESREKIYGATEYGVVVVDKSELSVQTITKSKGLSEVMVQMIGYDTATSTLVVGYQGGNIDLVQNGKVTNLPDLKNRQMAGSKTINQIYCNNGTAWLACGFGILRLDLAKKEISDTYMPGLTTGFINVNAIWADDETIFAATDEGVLSGSLDPGVNLANPASWTRYDTPDGIPAMSVSAIAGFNGDVYAAVSEIIYSFDGSFWTPFYNSGTGWRTFDMYGSPTRLLFSQQKFQGGNVVDKRIVTVSSTLSVNILPPDFYIERPNVLLEDMDGTIWFADFFRGIVRHEPENLRAYVPNGPHGLTSREMDFLNGTMWVASSGDLRSGDPNSTPGGSNGFYGANNYYWESFNDLNFPPLNGIFNIGVTEALPGENKVLFGTNSYGILEWDPSSRTLVQIEKPNPAAPAYRIMGADTDIYGNTWLVNSYSSYPLAGREPGGNYVHLTSSLLSNRLLFDIVADDYGQLWIPVSGSGLVVADYNGTPSDVGDDRYISYTTTPGAGGLPTNAVNTLANDLDGVLWIGTSEGIAVVYCPGSVFDRQCDAERICIPRVDDPVFCDILLEDEVVNTILVDAGNRKWVGTNNGLYLLSEDGFKTISYFNESNSPLLSNVVRFLAINPQNGDLYISTEKGINIYRGDATITDGSTEKLHVYPNPVRPDYSGPIAIKGLPNNAIVKITDITGMLVHETQALGGTATWDGLLSNGKRAHSGVYLVMAATENKEEKVVTKFVLIGN